MAKLKEVTKIIFLLERGKIKESRSVVSNGVKRDRKILIFGCGLI